MTIFSFLTPGAGRLAGVPVTTSGNGSPLNNGTQGYAPLVGVLGADGATPATASNGIPTAAYSRTSNVTVTPTVTASSAYTAAYQVGGLLTFANAFDAANSGVLESIFVGSKSVQTTGYKLYLFGSQPTATTWTDKTAPAINAADLPYLLGEWTLGASDSGLGTHTINQLDGIGASITGSSSTLYGVLVCANTPTYTSTSDVSVSIRIMKD